MGCKKLTYSQIYPTFNVVHGGLFKVKKRALGGNEELKKTYAGLNIFKFQDKEQLSNTFGLGGLNDFGPRMLDKTLGGIWSQPDILAEMNEGVSPFNYVNGQLLNMTDPSGLLPEESAMYSDGYGTYSLANATGAIGFTNYGGQGAPTDGPAKSKSGLLPGANSGRGSKGWYQKTKDIVMNEGPAYNDMSSFRKGINDIANTSIVSVISEWNPFYHGLNALNGIITGKSFRQEKMGGGAIAMAALSALPFSRTALGMTGSKVGIKVAGKNRFPDRIANGLLEEAKNVKHLNLTSQLRDYLTFSQNNGLRMILHTRTSTTLSKP